MNYIANLTNTAKHTPGLHIGEPADRMLHFDRFVSRRHRELDDRFRVLGEVTEHADDLGLVQHLHALRDHLVRELLGAHQREPNKMHDLLAQQLAYILAAVHLLPSFALLSRPTNHVFVQVDLRHVQRVAPQNLTDDVLGGLQKSFGLERVRLHVDVVQTVLGQLALVEHARLWLGG